MPAKKNKKTSKIPFWEKPLKDLSRSEWERLCDGCGRCCLIKLEDDDTGAIYPTSVCCQLLDQNTGLCGNYATRRKYVPDCVRLTLKSSKIFAGCAHALCLLRYADKPLPPWHPLISGDPESVFRAGVSVRGRIEADEREVDIDDLPDFIRLWPKRWPKKARW